MRDMKRPFVSAALLVCLVGAGGGAAEDFDELAAGARLALDTGRFKEAEGLFQRAAFANPRRLEELGPDYAWIYVLWGFEAARADNYDDANGFFGRAAQLCPSLKDTFVKQWLHVAGWVVGLGTDKARKSGAATDWEKVEKDAKALVSIQPDQPRSHYLSGLVYHFQHKNEEATEEYKAALGDKAPSGTGSLNDLYEAVRKVSDEHPYNCKLGTPVHPQWKEADPGDFQVLKKGRFKIYHHNKLVAQRVAAALEYYLYQPVLGGFISPKDMPSSDCEVYIYRTHEELIATTDKDRWQGGRAEQKDRIGTYNRDVILVYQAMPVMAQNSLPHELAHLRFYKTAYTRAKGMKWLWEGVASSAEGAVSKRHTAEQLIEARKDGKLIPAQQLLEITEWPKDESVVLVIYAESQALVESVVEKCGIEKFRQLADAFYVPTGEDMEGQFTDEDGQVVKPAEKFRDICGLSARDLDNMILAWATKHANDDLGAPGTVRREPPQKQQPAKGAPSARTTKK